MVLVDTSVWVDYFAGSVNPHTLWLDGRLGVQSIGLADLVYCEVLQGVRHDAQISLVRHYLDTLTIFNTGGQRFALAAAENYRFLRKRGITIRATIDCLIATLCIVGKHGLLHRDRDFDAFEAHLGLRVIHPYLPNDELAF